MSDKPPMQPSTVINIAILLTVGFIVLAMFVSCEPNKPRAEPETTTTQEFDGLGNLYTCKVYTKRYKQCTDTITGQWFEIKTDALGRQKKCAGGVCQDLH